MNEEKLKILLCEDDENLGMLLREYLQAKGYVAELCADGEAGFKAFLKAKFDICVLDVMMPKKDGFTLAQEIRAANADVPIIFLTAKTLKEDILEGFKLGADDYITKPFSMEELVFRIEAILRRTKGKKNKESTLYHIGKFTFDTQKQLLMIGDEQRKLTTKENELLALLCSHANEILQRDFALKMLIWFSKVGSGQQPLQRDPAARLRPEDHLDRRQLFQCPFDGRLHHQAAQAPEGRRAD